MHRSPRFRLAPFLVLAAASSACGRDHALGVGSTGGAASSSTTTTGESTSSGDGGASSTGTGTGGTSEPPGPTRVTVVNGVNDYDAIRVCFLPYPAGDPAAKPWPTTASGLLFAHAAVLDLAVDIPASTDVQPTIFAGDLSAIAGKTTAIFMARPESDPSSSCPAVCL